MAEALILLGDQDELEVIRAAIFSSSQESEVTAIACQIAGRLHDVEVTSTLESITLTPNRYPDEIRLIAATALAEINPKPYADGARFTVHFKCVCEPPIAMRYRSWSTGQSTQSWTLDLDDG